ncbi:hypothetical protein COOONC_25735 [Cooperia oncophora]
MTHCEVSADKEVSVGQAACAHLLQVSDQAVVQAFGGPGGMRPPAPGFGPGGRPGFGGPGGMRPPAPGFGPGGRPGFGGPGGMRPAAPGFGPGARPGGTNLGQTPMPIRRARNVQALMAC